MSDMNNVLKDMIDLSWKLWSTTSYKGQIQEGEGDLSSLHEDC